MSKYKLSIKGKNPDYFLRKIIERKVSIYDLEKKYNEIFITVDVEGYKKIKKIKTSYEVTVLDVMGILKVKEIFNKYFVFFSFFCLGIFLIMFLSNLIFDIEVVHSNKYIRDIVYKDLKKYGIDRLRFKVSFNEKEKIIEDILKLEKNDLEWLEIEEVGTKYIVKVEQRKKNKESVDCSNRNIVAKKNATILEISADQGEIVKKKLDYVLKGEVVISGAIHNKDDVVSNKCAIGKVFGEVWYKVNVELPMEYHEINLTGKSRYQLEANFLDKKLILFNGFNTYKKNNIFTFRNYLLPINISFAEYFETTEKHYTYTLNNCNGKALNIAEERLLSQLGTEDEILTKKVLKKEIKKSKIIVEVFIKVKEDITSYQNIVYDKLQEDGDIGVGQT